MSTCSLDGMQQNSTVTDERKMSSSTRLSNYFNRNLASHSMTESLPPSYRSLYPMEVHSAPPPYNESSKDEGDVEIFTEDKYLGNEEKPIKRMFLNNTSLRILQQNKARLRNGQYDQLKPLQVFCSLQSQNEQDKNYCNCSSIGTMLTKQDDVDCFSCTSGRRQSAEYALIPSISEVEARITLINHVMSYESRFSKKAANHVIINGVDTDFVWHYRLETLKEYRYQVNIEKIYSLSRNTEKSGAIPSYIWNFRVDVPANFEEQKRLLQASVMDTCKNCLGKGYVMYRNCFTENPGQHETHLHVNKTVPARQEQLKGNTELETCRFSATETMEKRNIHKCHKCNSTGKMEKSIPVAVQWKVERSDHTSAHCLPIDLRKDVLAKSGGFPVYEESGRQITPVTIEKCLSDEVITASLNFVKSHNYGLGNNARIRKQKQVVNLIPIHKVWYEINGSSHLCWVLGTEKYVFAPTFPRPRSFSCPVM